MTDAAAGGAPPDEVASRRAARPTLSIAGEVERLLVTESGFFLALGWADDEGLGTARWSLEAELGPEAVPAAALRAPVAGDKGVGFKVFGKADFGSLLRHDLQVGALRAAARFEAPKSPRIVSEKRLLDAFLEFIAGDVGGEAELHDFLAGPGGADLMGLVARHVAASLANPYVETFGARPVARAFVTPLGESAEPVATQPLLFRRWGLEFGQWVYVCSGREVGARALEAARWVAELYEAMITVVVLADDAGRGPACDLGVAHASADAIGLIAPDVYPAPAHVDLARAALAAPEYGGDLWGASLLADDGVAEEGLCFEQERRLRRGPAEPGAAAIAWPRVTPVRAALAGEGSGPPPPVAAIPLACMGFDRGAFERIGGFSSRYVYDGSEDSDLSLRWAQGGGRVRVDPRLRLLRLEGFPPRDGARRGAEIVNRGLFALRWPQLGARGRGVSGRPLRLLFVAYDHPAIHPGGSQQIAYELFRAAQAAGHDATLLCGMDAETALKYGAPGTPIVPLFGEAGQFLFFPGDYDFSRLSVCDLGSIEAFGAFVRRLAPDVVHFHHYHRIGVEMLRVARVAAPEAAIGLTLHEMLAICMADGLMLKRPTGELCEAASPVECARCFVERRPEFFALRASRLEALLRECDVFVFPSEFLAERYLAWGLDARKCVVIPNGLKHPAPDFDRRRHSPHVNRFGFFGQHIDHKGVDVLVEALLTLARENRVPACGVEVEINGGNRQYATAAYLEQIDRRVAEIAALGVGPIRLRENGPYERGDLARRMGAVDWVVAPSTWWETFGLVVSEAWMFGRPVIVSDIAGLAERVRGGVGGVTFPVRDARALADRIAGFAGAEEEWRALASSIEPPWDERQMLSAYLTIWGETLQARRPVDRPD